VGRGAANILGAPRLVFNSLLATLIFVNDGFPDHRQTTTFHDHHPQYMNASKDTAARYNPTARTLHWVSALVILWATVSGFYITTQSIDDTIKQQIASFNVSVTLVFIPLFVLRVLYRIRHGVPAYGRVLAGWEINAARAMQLFLYASASVVLLSGVLMMKQDFSVFHLLTLPNIINDPAALAFFKGLHTFSTIILALCVAFHLLALARHEIAGRRILNRMI